MITVVGCMENRYTLRRCRQGFKRLKVYIQFGVIAVNIEASRPFNFHSCTAFTPGPFTALTQYKPPLHSPNRLPAIASSSPQNTDAPS